MLKEVFRQNENCPSRWAWWCTPVIPATQKKLRQEGCKFKASLNNLGTLSQNKI
jgi:hypothetical protein